VRKRTGLFSGPAPFSFGRVAVNFSILSSSASSLGHLFQQENYFQEKDE
jgi:hypothetical protein